MTDDTKLAHADSAQVAIDATPAPAVDDRQARKKAHKQALADRKAHLTELEKRVKRDDYSPEKIAKYRAALARARTEVKTLEQEATHGTD